jgi:hypothetical protein
MNHNIIFSIQVLIPCTLLRKKAGLIHGLLSYATAPNLAAQAPSKPAAQPSTSAFYIPPRRTMHIVLPISFRPLTPTSCMSAQHVAGKLRAGTVAGVNVIG